MRGVEETAERIQEELQSGELGRQKKVKRVTLNPPAKPICTVHSLLYTYINGQS